MRRTFLAVAVTASLLTSGASPGTFERLRTLLSGLWGASAGTDEGCIMDPYGGCRPTPEPQTDEGCGWDPYGCPGS